MNEEGCSSCSPEGRNDSSECSLEMAESPKEAQTEDLLAKVVKSRRLNWLRHHFSVRTMMLLGALLPGAGCYFCVAYAYVFQFETIRNFSTNNCEGTHTWVPPVSYTIGLWKPQKYIWMFIMFVHFPPRFAFIVLYRRLFLGNASETLVYRCLLKIFLITMWLEPIGLVCVSVLDITLFELHALSYCLWLIPFNCNMVCNVYMHHFSEIRNSNDTHEITWRIKLFLCVSGLVLSLSTAVSYPIFLSSCDTTAYYAFSAAEYLLVGYNSLFYFMAYWEFPRIKLALGLKHLHTIDRVKVYPKRVLEKQQMRKARKKVKNLVV